MDYATWKYVVPVLMLGAVIVALLRLRWSVHVNQAHAQSRLHADDATDQGYVTDSVCGTRVKRDHKATATVHQRKAYYFCSKSCRDKFEAQPETYAARAAGDEAHHVKTYGRVAVTRGGA